jgi:hypothetical protein
LGAALDAEHQTFFLTNLEEVPFASAMAWLLIDPPNSLKTVIGAVG